MEGITRLFERLGSGDYHFVKADEVDLQIVTAAIEGATGRKVKRIVHGLNSPGGMAGVIKRQVHPESTDDLDGFLRRKVEGETRVSHKIFEGYEDEELVTPDTLSSMLWAILEAGLEDYCILLLEEVTGENGETLQDILFHSLGYTLAGNVEMARKFFALLKVLDDVYIHGESADEPGTWYIETD